MKDTCFDWFLAILFGVIFGIIFLLLQLLDPFYK